MNDLMRDILDSPDLEETSIEWTATGRALLADCWRYRALVDAVRHGRAKIIDAETGKITPTKATIDRWIDRMGDGPPV